MRQLPATAFSLQGKAVFFALAVSLTSLAVAAVSFYYLPFAWALALCATLVIPATIVLAMKATQPAIALINALGDATDNIRDQDFSTSIACSRRDELGALVKQHNELGDLLRAERYNINQRELLLDTVLQSSPVAMLLCDPGGHVVYSNVEARQLLGAGKRLQGLALEAVLAQVDPALSLAISNRKDGLFSMELAHEIETFYLSCRRFSLNGRSHTLHLIRRMTRELSRQEVATWKRVIRVISHELNNSLAPISSLSHSGLLAMKVLQSGQAQPDDGQQDWQKLQLILTSIGERATHLKEFIEGYARFARLPAPRIASFGLAQLLQHIAQQHHFNWDMAQCDLEVQLDETQIEQVLINLLKNARDASGIEGEVTLQANLIAGDLLLVIADDGPGMSEQVLQQALLPFYSTKKDGTGLGLPLCREIIEAHGGQLSIRNGGDGGLEAIMRIPQQHG